MSALGYGLCQALRFSTGFSRIVPPCRQRLSYPPSPTSSFFPPAGPSRSFNLQSSHHLHFRTAPPPQRSALSSIGLDSMKPLLRRILKPQCRTNSSTSPSSTTTLSKPPPTQPTSTPQASSAPSTSLLSRFTSIVSLTPIENNPKSEAGHGSSSVAKLVQLAKPEVRQLSIAVGLVRPISNKVDGRS